MNKFFDMNSPAMQVLGKMADLMILGLLTLLCCLPVFTIGPALTALHYVMLKIVRGEEGAIVKSYFRAFRDNFRQGVAIGLIYTAIYAAVAADMLLLSAAKADSMTVAAIRLAVIIAAAFVFVFSMWVFPYLSHFEGTVKQTIKNATLLALAKFPRTVLMAAVWLIPFAVLKISMWLIPIVVFFGLSVPALLMNELVSPVFRELEDKLESGMLSSGS